MIAWKSELMALLRLLAANTEHSAEMVVALVVGLVVAVIVLQKTAKATRCAMADSGRCAAIMVSGALIVLAGTIAINLYIVPQVKNDVLVIVLPIATALILILGLVTPLAMFLLKGSYFKCLAPIGLAIVAALTISFVVRGAGGAIRKGGKDFGKTKERTDNVNKIL